MANSKSAVAPALSPKDSSEAPSTQVIATPAPRKSAPGGSPLFTSGDPFAGFNVGEAIGRVLSESSQPQPGKEPSPELEEAPLSPEPEDAPAPETSEAPDIGEEKSSEDSTDSADGEEIKDETEEGTEETAPKETRNRWKERVDGLTARMTKEKERAAAAEQERDELRAKLEAVAEDRHRAPPADAGVELSDVQDFQALQKVEVEARAVQGWVDAQMIALRRNPEAVEAQMRQYKLASAEEALERDEMEARLIELRQNVERKLREVPARGQYLQQAAQAEAITREAFPWWKDKTHADTLEAQRILQELQRVPLHRRADAAYHANVYLTGAKALRAQALAKANPAAGARPIAKPPRAPQAGVGNGSPSSHAGSPDPLAPIRSRISKGEEGSVRDFFAAALARRAA